MSHDVAWCSKSRSPLTQSFKKSQYYPPAIKIWERSFTIGHTRSYLQTLGGSWFFLSELWHELGWICDTGILHACYQKFGEAFYYSRYWIIFTKSYNLVVSEWAMTGIKHNVIVSVLVHSVSISILAISLYLHSHTRTHALVTRMHTHPARTCTHLHGPARICTDLHASGLS